MKERDDTELLALEADLLNEWQLRDLARELYGGWNSRVFAVETHTGQAAVLKLADAMPEDEHFTAREIDALRLMEGPAMVPLLEADVPRRALLLTHLQPGDTLAAVAREDDERATTIALSLMEQLHREVPEGSTFPTVADHFALYGGVELNGPHRVMLRKGLDLFTELSASVSQPKLLHGDLHHGNVLQHGDEWVAIDPDPIVADLAYEPAAMLRNPFVFTEVSRPDQMLRRRIDQCVEVLGVDRTRVTEWAFARTCLALAHTDAPDRHAQWTVCAQVLEQLTRGTSRAVHPPSFG